MTSQRHNVTRQESFARPFKQLIETALLLVGFVVVAIVGIGLVKQQLDLRVDTGISRETISRARGLLAEGKGREAEEVLITAVTRRPRLLKPLTWEFIDFLAVMPRYWSSVGEGLESERPPWLAAEAALRAGHFQRIGQMLGRGISAHELRFANAYLAFAFLEARDVSKIPWPPSPPQRVDLDAVHPNAFLRSVGPLATEFGSDAHSNSAADEDYVRGRSAFWKGALEESRVLLERALQRQIEPADSAYINGVISEAFEDLASAQEWYALALATEEPHLGAATAYLRIVSASD